VTGQLLLGLIFSLNAAVYVVNKPISKE
jgi:hypothetical protein